MPIFGLGFENEITIASATITVSAARKMSWFGRKLVVPSSFRIVSAFTLRYNMFYRT